jgi:hypothetical protein
MLPSESSVAWAELMHTLETGEPAYDKVFGDRKHPVIHIALPGRRCGNKAGRSHAPVICRRHET